MSVPQAKNSASPGVAPLSYFKHNDLNLAGGKGANLGELLNAGFPVPSGFIVTTVAYDHLVRSQGIQTQINSFLASCDFDNSASVRETSQQITSLFQKTPIPGKITGDILKAYHEMDAGAVAVRSSATAEDLPEATFAGQQETFLNVIGEVELISAVRACWASLWSERAMIYRGRQDIEQSTIKLAVVVQQMIQAEAAGVMFTANPLSGKRDELIIDANPGLGEAVVSGLVTPDHFLVQKRKLRIMEQQLGRREVVIRAKKGGGTEQIKPEIETPSALALPIQAAKNLAQLGINIERHFGTPQDIEWAWMQDHSTNGKIYILQSRPMTALPEPLKVSGPMRLVLPMLAEMWPSRPYPLDMTTFTGAIERAIGGLLVAMIGKSAPDPADAFVEEDGVIVEFKPPQVHPSPSMLITPWITMWRTRHYDLSRWQDDPLLTEYISKVHVIEKRDLPSLTWEQNIVTLKEALALLPQLMKLRENYLPKALLGLSVLWTLLFLARRGNQLGALVSGVRTKTTETNAALEDIAKRIRSEKELRAIFRSHDAQILLRELKFSRAGRGFLGQFEDFLARYGHRETSLTISQPAWKDQPESVLAILKVLMETEAPKLESYDAWHTARDQLITCSILGARLLRGLFLKSLTCARYLFQIREDTHFYATMVQPAIRHVALELGKRLVETGALDNVEDVFHLKLDELQAFDEGWPPTKQVVEQTRSLVARRKNKRASLTNKPMFDPRLLTATSQTEEGVLLKGTSGSPGIARGPARMVHDVSEFGKLRAGDVLVAPVTNPSWTPLFQRAAAVVVDTGSLASHAAIVAREYGIPAVMGTMNGTSELTDGQWIEVDGSRGLVLKAEVQK